MGLVKIVSTDNFDAEVLSNKKATIVEFGASWCHSCKNMIALMEEVQSQHDEYTLCSIDIDDSPELVKQYKVRAAPTIISFINGKQYKIHIGPATKAQLLQLTK